jgi:protocatechuate 3,4-dioxygenase beta subunit
MHRNGINATCATVTALLLLATACGDNTEPLQPTTGTLYTTPTGLVTANPPQIFIGAGDMSSCGNNGDEATAQIIDTIPGTVYTLGDNVYENGTNSEFSNCYHPTWGRFKARTKPSAGNHDYNTSGASGYYNYYGAAAGDPSKGYYSYDLGLWHIIVLNSNISMGASSPQNVWLQGVLAAHPNQCKLAYMHHPLWSSTGGSGSGGVYYSGVRELHNSLYAGGTDVILTGHRHFYERLARMKPDGSADAQNGFTSIIVGSGGIGGGGLENKHPRSVTGNGDTRGVLKMYLYDDSFAWKFIPQAGKTYTDSGSVACMRSSGGGGGGVSASLSTVAAAPTSIAASSGGTTSLITVTARDASNNPVSGASVVLSATGSGNTIAQPSGTTGANGVATGTISSTGAGPKTVSATINGTAITQTALVTVTAGPPSASQSTVGASPASILVGSGTSTITVTVKDGFGNPVSGASVNLSATGSGNTLTQPGGLTGANGVATGTLSSTVVETKTVSATVGALAITQTATVQVTSEPVGGGPITHTLLTAGNATPNQSTYATASIAPAPNALITVAVLGHRSSGASPAPTLAGGGITTWTQVASVTFDPLGTPRKRLTIYRAMSAAPGSGPITIQFANSQSNAQWVVSQWVGVETGGVNGANAIGQTGVNAADAVSSLGVTLGGFGNATSVAYGAFAVASPTAVISPGAGFTEISEQPSGEGTGSDLMVEQAVGDPTIDATWSSRNGGAVGIEIRAAGASGPAVSASQSGVSAAPTTIAASNGASASTITVTARDASGNPVSGATVVIAATGTGNTITQPAGPTNSSGMATGTLWSTVPGSKTVSATANGVAITQTAGVTVSPGAPAVLAFLTQPSNVLAGATMSPAVQVGIRDALGNLVTGATNDVTVAIGNNAGGGTLSGTLTVAAVNGVATFSTLSINNVGTGYTLTAAATGLTGATSSGFNVTGVPPSPSLSTVAAAPSSITAGSGSATVTVTARDASNAPISGATVVISATGTGNTVTQPVGPTNGSGVATGTLSSTVAGAKTVSATIDGVAITQTAVVTVTADVPSATTSTVSASPTSITVGTGTSTITVTVKDAHGNPVSGVTVSLAATGTGNTVTQPAAATNASGVATGTLSSTVAESKTVSASAGGTPISQTAAVTVTAAATGQITHTLLTAGNNTTNQSTYATASISPAPNALVTIAVMGHRSYGASAEPTVTGGGMAAWVPVASVTYDVLGTPLKRVTVFRAMSPAPGSGPITITFAGSQSNAQWIVSQWDGAETSGANGSGAIVQALTNAADAVNGLGVNLASFGNSANVAFGVFGVTSSTPAVTAGSGFTEIAEIGSAESQAGSLMTEWAVNLSTINASWTNLRGAVLGVEIRAKTGP